MKGVLSQGYKVNEIASIGITNQRETTIAWNRVTGKPYYNSIVWCDTRTEHLCDQIIHETPAGQDRFRGETGLPISTYFSALKIKWLLENCSDFANDLRDETASKDVCIGTVDSWLLYRLTGEFKTDVSNASRTMLFNINILQWDESICSFFGLKNPSINLPSVHHNTSTFGTIHSNLPFGGVNICGVLGDQQASLLGFGCLSFGEVKNTYGTGCFLLMNTGSTLIPSKNGLLTTIGFQLGENNTLLKQSIHFNHPTTPTNDNHTIASSVGNVCYALEGSVASCGSLLTWLIESMKIAENPKVLCDYALEVTDNANIVIIPAFTGLLSPYFCLDARGLIIGLTRYATNKHLCRAVLEAISMSTRDVVEAMKHDVIENNNAKQNDSTRAPDHCQQEPLYNSVIKSLKIDGGVTKSNFLCTFQSDVLGIPVFRAIMQERTALGAALAAGLGSGFYTSLDQVQEQVWSGTCDATHSADGSVEIQQMECPELYKPLTSRDGFYVYESDTTKRGFNLPLFIRKWAVAIEKCKGWASIE
jgi:glycerol kinase